MGDAQVGGEDPGAHTLRPGGGGRDALRALRFGAEPSAQAPWGPSWPTTASSTVCAFLGLPDLRLQCPET